ncbi:MAG: hypothetical protein AB1797_12595 [bacterium]
MKVKIGVMGSASGKLDEKACRLAYRLGQEIAKKDCILLTGGCPGLPYEATKGAKAAGGMTIGVSPAHNLTEHIDAYKSPYDHLDVLIYTGSGLMGREVICIRSCDIVIIVGGRSGTLGEFSMAYDEGKLIGVLEGTGGITAKLREMAEVIKKQTRSQIVYSSHPEELVDKLLTVNSKVNRE